MKLFQWLLIVLMLVAAPSVVRADPGPAQGQPQGHGQLVDVFGRTHDVDHGQPIPPTAGHGLVDHTPQGIQIHDPTHLPAGKTLRDFPGAPVVDADGNDIGIVDPHGNILRIRAPQAVPPQGQPGQQVPDPVQVPDPQVQPQQGPVVHGPRQFTPAGRVKPGSAAWIHQSDGAPSLLHYEAKRPSPMKVGVASGVAGGAVVAGAVYGGKAMAAGLAGGPGMVGGLLMAPVWQAVVIGAPIGYGGYQAVKQVTRRVADKRGVEAMNHEIAHRYNSYVQAHLAEAEAQGIDAATAGQHFDQGGALHAAKAETTRTEHRRVGPWGLFKSKWTQTVDGNGHVIGTTDRAPKWYEFRERSRMNNRANLGAQRTPDAAAARNARANNAGRLQGFQLATPTQHR
jgi:hypothetical protein